MVATDKSFRDVPPGEALFNGQPICKSDKLPVEAASDGADFSHPRRFMSGCATPLSWGKRLRPILALLLL